MTLHEMDLFGLRRIEKNERCIMKYVMPLFTAGVIAFIIGCGEVASRYH